MKIRLVSSILLFALSATTAFTEEVKQEAAFKSGGRIEMRLGGGDYEVRAGASDKIVVTAVADKAESGRPVKVNLSSTPETAQIKTSGPHNNFHVVIEVPAQANLYIRLAAGDMTVRNIEGSKDIETHAGDVDIYVGDPNSYRNVDASVGVGDLTADAFETSKSGFFRSFHQTRQGKYDFHAHVGAGDLNLH